MPGDCPGIMVCRASGCRAARAILTEHRVVAPQTTPPPRLFLTMPIPPSKMSGLGERIWYEYQHFR